MVSSYLTGLPGLGASANPATRCLANRVRHLLTVAARTCNKTATSFVVFPAAASKTMRARCAMRCSVVVLRAQDSKLSRSSLVNSIVVATPMQGVYYLPLFIDSRY